MNQNVKTALIIKDRAVAAISTSSYEEQVLDDYTDRYEAWYNSAKGRALLATEVACLRPLVELFPRPYMEVGVGTGNLAKALGIEWGVDPSLQALEKARRRGVNAVLGTGEHLPFKDTHFGGVLIAFTLCFVRNPDIVMSEVWRVLAPNGGLILGLLLKGTPWADFYARRGAEGHPLYRTAHFYSRERVETLLKQNGFRITANRSTLFQEPGLEVYEEEQSVDSYVPGAGFVGIAAVKTKRPSPRKEATK